MESWSSRIRPARVSDAAGLALLSGELGYPSTEEQTRRRLRFLSDPEHVVLVADAGDGLAGFVDVHVQRPVEVDPFAEIGGLVVTASHRRGGLGSALLAAGADWSRSRGLRRMWIRARLGRAGAHQFYRAAGCRIIKDQRVYEYPL